MTAFAYRSIGDVRDADGRTIVRANADTPNLLLKGRQRLGDPWVEASSLHLEAKGGDQNLNQLEGPQPGLFPRCTGWGVGDTLTRDQMDDFYDSSMGGGPSPDLTEETGRTLEAGISDAASDLWAQGDRLAVKVTLLRDRIERTNAPQTV